MRKRSWCFGGVTSSCQQGKKHTRSDANILYLVSFNASYVILEQAIRLVCHVGLGFVILVKCIIVDAPPGCLQTRIN